MLAQQTSTHSEDTQISCERHSIISQGLLPCQVYAQPPFLLCGQTIVLHHMPSSKVLLCCSSRALICSALHLQVQGVEDQLDGALDCLHGVQKPGAADLTVVLRQWDAALAEQGTCMRTTAV